METKHKDISSQTLYVRGLNRKLPIKEVKRRLHHLVSRHTEVSKVKMTNNSRMLGQAFVLLKEASDRTIVDKLNGKFFLSNIISVSFANKDMCIGKRDTSITVVKSKTLIVTEIPEVLTKEDIKKLFEGSAELQGVRFIKVKNLALIDFLSIEGASAVYLELEDGFIDCNGHRLKISPSL